MLLTYDPRHAMSLALTILCSFLMCIVIISINQIEPSFLIENERISNANNHFKFVPFLSEGDDSEVSNLALLGGTVYREFKHNGEADLGNEYRYAEEGYPGVVVNIYGDDLVLLQSVTSESDGVWSADVAGAAGTKVLIEFIIPAEFSSGPSGLNNKTSILITELGTTTNDFTLGLVSDHCQDNPTIATACFPGPVSPSSTVVTIEYQDSGNFTLDQNAYPHGSISMASASTAANIAFEAQTGFINGVAWDRTHKNILSASFAKITSKTAPETIGEVYKTNNGVTSLWLNLETIFPNSTGRTLFDDGSATTNTDQDVKNIGYIGFTDIEINTDDSEVYLYNAFDRNVYIIQVDELTGEAITTNIKKILIPAICSGTNGNGFAYSAAGGLGFYGGRVYASTTCTGPSVNDLQGAVHSFDPSESTPTTQQEFIIDYSNWVMPDIFIGGIGGYTNGDYLSNDLAVWSEGLSSVTPYSTTNGIWNIGTGHSDFAPWAMDIEFDIHPNGDVGMNIITKNRAIDATETFNDPTNGGYMTKAALNISGSWDLESNGDAGAFSTGLNKTTPSDPLLNIFQRGQPDASFYHGEGLEGPSANGGAVVIPGFKEIVTSNTDNVLGNYDSGFSFHDVKTGLKTRDVNILQGGNVGFAKGNSWGDLQVMCELPALEIGNYVWLDIDKDGIQDPSEKPQPGIPVELWKDTDNDDVGDLYLGTAITNDEGYYFFGGALDANTTQEIVPFMNYELRISLPEAQNVLAQISEFTLPDNTGDKFDSDFKDTIISGQMWAYATLYTSNTELIFHDFDAGLVPQCDLVIENFSFINCAESGGTYGADLTFDVSYIAAPFPSEDLLVQIDGVDVDGSPFTISAGDCSTLNFSIPTEANGSINHVLTAFFETSSGCGQTIDYKNPVPCQADVSLDCTNFISGVAFIDVDHNGINENVGGVAGVEVLAYDCDNNLVGSSYTDMQGEYIISETSAGVEYRIEFVLNEAILCNYKPTSFGASGGTSVQFGMPGSCYDFGLGDPNACLDPAVAVVCFARNNDPGTEPTIIFVNEEDARDFPAPQSATDVNGLWGIPTGSNATNYPLTYDEIANVGEINTTFGLEWNGKHKALFTGSFVRAFAPLASNGTDLEEATIYKIPVDLANGLPENPVLWLDLETILGANIAGAYIDDPTYPGPATYGQTGANPNLIGYTGLGSIKLSKDNTELYVVNLHTREIYVIPIDEDCNPPSSSSEIKVFPIPTTQCGGSHPDGRPIATVLGLGVHPKSGRVYASLTCTGPTLSDLNGYVYSFDPADDTPSSSDFQLELSIPLNIVRPATSPNTQRFWAQTNHPWESVSSNSVFYTNNPQTGFSLGNEFVVQHMQPWLGEIGFDIKPNGECGMIIGERNRYHDLINGSFYVTGGVIYRACGEEGAWNLEENGSCGTYNSEVNYSYSGTAAGVYTSPTNRFFKYIGREGTMGAGTITVSADGCQLILPVLDNLFNSATSGITWLNTSNGERLKDIRILGDFSGAGYTNTNFTKSNNWGAITQMCNEVPIEIGNYVWLDEIKNGIQDACEPGIESIDIELYLGSTLVGTTITDANGQFYFNHTNVDVLDYVGTPETGFTGLDPLTTYKIVIRDYENCGDPSSTTKFSITESNINSNNSDHIDNDAIEVGDDLELIFTTGEFGCHDHTVDIGLFNLITCTASNSGPVCEGTETQLFEDGEIAVSWAWSGPGSFTSIEQNPTFISDSASSGVYTVIVTDGDGCTFECNTEVVVNDIVPEVTLLPISICAESTYGINTVDLSSLISEGPITGTWSDTDSSGGLSGSVFTADVTNRNNSYTFTYTVIGDGPAGTECETKTFDVLVTVIDCRLDLALRKTVSPDGPYQYGDTLTYLIEVFNQGAITVSNVEVYDTIPCGLKYETDLNLEWDYLDNIATVSFDDQLLGGTSVSKELKLIIQKCDSPGIGNYYNAAEISNFKDEDGNESVLTDTDSDPDSDTSNDGDPIDNMILDPDDEDDQDFENIEICDLALKNQIDEIPADLSVGDTIKYEVVIFNQGNTIANETTINYLVPNGLNYLPKNNDLSPQWSEIGTSLATISTEKILTPGESDTVCIYLELKNLPTDEATEDSFTTLAEIVQFLDENGQVKLEDVDSTPDPDFTNDSGGNPDDDTDNEIEGSGEGDPNDESEDTDPLLDEDDHDPAIIYVCDVATIIDRVEDTSVTYGEEVKFIVEVHNQGNGPITNILLQNLYGDGFEYIESVSNMDAGWNMDEEGKLSLLVEEIINSGEKSTICLYMEVVPDPNSSEDSWSQNVEVVSFEDPTDPGVSKSDVDSSPDDDPINDPGGNLNDEDTDDLTDGDGSGDPLDSDEDTDPNLDEDDQDMEEVEVCDLALINQIVVENNPPQVGDTIKYEIVLFNQGNTISNGVTVNYLVPNGLTYLPKNDNLLPKWNELNTGLASVETSKLLAPGERDTVCIYLELMDLTIAEATEESFTTLAEIVQILDEEDQPKLEDIDSVPDTDFNNDSGGNTDDLTDNTVEGSGEGDPDIDEEDTDPLLDEDDHDPAYIYACDVATLIDREDDTPVSYGEEVKFFVEVHNQGNGPITNIYLQNIFGEGLLFVDNLSNTAEGWELTAEGKLNLLIDETIEPGQKKTICLWMQVTPDLESTEDSWSQNVEVVYFEDPSDPGVSKTDIDSVPDDITDNDSGGNLNDPDTDDIVDGDGMGDSDDPDDNTDPMLDEDDQDMEDLEICDLALINTIVDIPEDYAPGDTVKYEVIIYNQGNTIANSINVNYHIPNGLIYLPVNDGLDTPWDLSSSTLAELNTNEILLPGETQTLCLYLELTNLPNDEVGPDSWTTLAEITNMLDENNEIKTLDIDSEPDMIPDNDSGGNTDDDTDDVIDGSGEGDPNDEGEDTDADLDEDDHDPTLIVICDAAATISTNDNGPFVYGSLVKYDVVIFNQGNGPLTNLVLHNNFGDGLSFTDNENNETFGWSQIEEGLLTTTVESILEVGASINLCLEMIIEPSHPASDVDWLQQIEIVSFEDPAEPGVFKDDFDSVPDTDPENDSGGNSGDDTDDEVDGTGQGDPNDEEEDTDADLDEDDHDPVDLKIFDLALKMQIDSMPPVLPVVPGDVMKFNVVVYNQGNVPATEVALTNYIMDDNLMLGSQSANIGWDELGSGKNEVIIDGVILPGESDTTCIYLEVISGAMANIITYSEISGTAQTDSNECYDMDSFANDVQDDDAGGNIDDETDDHIIDDGHDYNDDGIIDEDDHDPANLIVQDLALIIWAEQKLPVQVADDVKFTIRVTNQGNVTNQNIKIANYIPEGFELSEYDTNDWEFESEKIVSKTLPGVLEMDQSTETCILLKVLPGVSADELINYAEIVSSQDELGMYLNDRDVDSTPDMITDNDLGGQHSDLIDCDITPVVIGDDNFIDGAATNGEDEDDHDPAWVPVLDLATIIYTDQTDPIIPGDEIKFIVDCVNQGNIAVVNTLISVDLPLGFSLSENNEETWVLVEEGLLQLMIDEELGTDQEESICLNLIVNPDFVLEDLIPFVEISSTEDTFNNDMSGLDIDSDPDTNFENDAGGIPDEISDNEMMENGIDGNDEDDHDPVVPPVLDLAIKIVNVNPDLNEVGDLVKFQISVYNQGSIIPTSFMIENYVPPGLIFNSSALNDGWIESGDHAIYEYSEELQSGTSDTLCIYLEIAANADPTTVVDMVEITQVFDQFLNDVSAGDIDSYADSSNTNDLGNDLYSLEDNKLTENGRSGADEDDHDQAFVLLCEEVVCHNHLNVSLDEFCSVDITANMMLSPARFPEHMYQIEITDEYGNIMDENFDAHDIGKTFNVSVIVPICEYNSCWGTITVEDKFAPVLECNSGPFDVPCNALDQIPLPTANENCSDYTIVLINETEEQFECEEMTGRVTRTYIAIDAAGNESPFPCVQVINIVRPDLSMVTAPAPKTFSCNEDFPKDEFGNPAPWVPSMTGSGSGVPILCQPGYGIGVDCLTGSGTGDGIYLIPGPQDLICNTYVSYEDTVIPTNTCTTKIMRRFVVREWWCGGEITYPYVQFLEIVDDKGPEITCPTNITVGTDYGCDADLILPSIVPVDECGSETFVKLEIAGNDNGFPGAFLDQNGGVVNLPIGENLVTYIAYDACYNSSSCTMTVTVEDTTQPVPVCEQNTVISLPSDGNTEVWAETFDDGSNDECAIDRFVVRRMNSECDTSDLHFDDSVFFCCADVGQEVMVVMRVYDYSGNWNECMVNVHVQDKVAPVITCPADLTTICTTPYDLNNLDLTFGEATVIDNCQTEDLIEVVTEEVSSCGVGTITREFQIKDEFGNVISSCDQLITLLIDEPMTSDDIIWPLDVDLFDECTIDQANPEDLPLDQGYPIVVEGVCDLVGFNYSDELFSNVGGSDACAKIIRTWQVVNWCQTDTNGDLVIWTHDQVLLIFNTVDPEIIGNCDAVIFSSLDINCNAVDISVTNSATDDCTPIPQLEWEWTIDTFNDGELTSNVTGLGSTITGTYPVGIHTINWVVRDQCGNIDFCDQKLVIINEKSPNAVCIYGLSAELVPMDIDNNGVADVEMATIWASDFDASSTHPCGYDIELSFSADVEDKFVSFGCNQLGVQEVELWVTDENGNTAKCVTFINITNNIEELECTIMADGNKVSGKIMTEDDREVEAVMVNLSGSNLSELTNEDGEYIFPAMPIGGSYTVDPSKNDDLLNGVTTLDLIHIQRHILGLDDLDSPYQYIAADVNKSGNISGIDLVELRKAILGVSDNFRSNESWRFIDKNFSFIEGTDILDQSPIEKYEIPMLMEDQIVDFVGVKIGDVNGSVVLDNIAGNNLLSARELNKLPLKATANGSQIDFSLENSQTLRGYQISFSYNPEVNTAIVVESGIEDWKKDMFNISQESGLVNISWNGSKSMTLSSVDVLFSIVFNEIPNIDLLKIDQGNMKAEAYADNFEIFNLTFKNSEVVRNLILDQNTPNPWSKSTNIQYTVDNSQDVEFIFRDASGQLLHKLTASAKIGKNLISVESSDLNTSGVIYYEMISDGQRITKKMILIR